MSAILNCCNPCATTETVNIPGTEGPAGADGVNGINAFTTTNQKITVAKNGGEVSVGTIGVVSSVWMVVGQIVIIGRGYAGPAGENDFAHFRVADIPSDASVTLTYLDYPDDAAVDGELLAGCTVSPAGPPAA